MNRIDDLKVIPKSHNLMTLKTHDAEKCNRAYIIFKQIQWNDPRENQDSKFIKSLRGLNMHFFNYDVIHDFLKNSNIKRMIKAHKS